MDNAIHQPQLFVELPFDQLHGSSVNIPACEDYREPLDEDSIEMAEYRGELYYHPVVLAHRMYVFLGTYHGTGNETHLARAEKYARKLMDISYATNGARYIPYTVRYAVHGDSSITLPQPWYSGMAQGENLAIMTRLYELTDNPEYLEYARQLFRSLTRLQGAAAPWVVRLDSLDYYWIEEYPHDQRPGQTLNGYQFAVVGLYDYYRVTKEPDAHRVYELALTTLKQYLPFFRRPGQTSYYCLGHKAVTDEYYHGLHIYLTEKLFEMTGDPFFEIMALALANDAEAFSDGSSFPSSVGEGHE